MAVSIVIKVLLWVGGSVILYVIYELVMSMVKPELQIIYKDNRIGRYKKFPKRGLFTYKGASYPVDAAAVQGRAGLMFWGKVYTFDEGSVKPRVIAHKRDVWMGAEAMTKVLNDETVKAMAGEIIGKGEKFMIFLAAVCSVINLFVVSFIALNILGVLK